MRIKLRAIKRCPGAKPGEEFTASSVEAKALVALGFAKRLDSPAYSQQHPVPVLTQEPAVVGRQILASDTVRKFAVQAGVEIAAIAGTGKDGRITRADVEAAKAKRQE